MLVPNRRRQKKNSLMTNQGNVLNAFVNLLVNVLRFKRKEKAAYHLKMLAVYRSLRMYWFSTTCNQSKRNIK